MSLTDAPAGAVQAFIRRVPHQAQAIELTIVPAWIPPLDRPYKF